MIIRLTQKLAKKIKVAPPAALPRDPNPFADWAANLFTANRTQYILLTNSTSLYSVIFPGRGVTDAEAFINHAFSALALQLESEGHGGLFKTRIIPHFAEVVFSKIGDRSLLGSMNDQIQGAKAYLMDDSPATTTLHLNSTPMGGIGYRFPNEEFTKQGQKSRLAKGAEGKVILFPKGEGYTRKS